MSPELSGNGRALRVSVSHPHGNANSYQAALAFSERGWLEHFETGILNGAIGSEVARRLSATLERRVQNRSFDGIPEACKKSHRLFEALARAGRRLRPGGLTSEINWYDVLFSGHDFQVSRTFGDIDAVYAYEDAARRTFAAANKRGVGTVYELPLGYYKGVAREINRAGEDWPNLQPVIYSEPSWKQQRKDAEIGLADVIVVASRWARESLSWSDAVSGKPVIAVPYGTPVGEIGPRQQRPAGPFTVLFAGQIGLRKGVPHLLAAWEKLNLRDARLWLAGPMGLPRNYLREHRSSFDHLGALPRVELIEAMKQADLFVFPSLAEGFGLVIGEAMACGVPVLTTTNTGGPELITDDQEGWCVQAHEVEPLARRIQWASQNRDRLFEMGRLARQRAEQWTWADYRRRLIAELEPHLRELVSRKAPHTRENSE